MAASSKVNASVEQANVSTGWDEAHSEGPGPAIKPEIKKKSQPALSSSSFDAIKVPKVEREIRSLLMLAKDRFKELKENARRQAQWVKEEHPGYIVIAAAVVGFAGGILLRARRRRFDRYE